MTDETLTHCDGCDEPQEDVRSYIACFGNEESSKWGRVKYCPDCYDMACMNWNGETLAIAPTSGDETGEDVNARVRAAAEAMGL